jgi:hypothetical protein
MASKPNWVDITTLSDRELESHIVKIFAYLKSLDNPNIKAVADECDAPYPRLYHRFHSRLSRYDHEGPNRHLSVEHEEALCRF